MKTRSNDIMPLEPRPAQTGQTNKPIIVITPFRLFIFSSVACILFVLAAYFWLKWPPVVEGVNRFLAHDDSMQRKIISSSVLFMGGLFTAGYAILAGIVDIQTEGRRCDCHGIFFGVVAILMMTLGLGILLSTMEPVPL